ncbi:hypothetical protein ACIRVN_28835 [Streptomyces albogriseolus]|uniref:hypothetical protein n=1 Tax=Streptomyces albogriseolus TaxID=1887 RepID=UPI00380B296D
MPTRDCSADVAAFRERGAFLAEQVERCQPVLPLQRVDGWEVLLALEYATRRHSAPCFVELPGRYSDKHLLFE